MPHTDPAAAAVPTMDDTTADRGRRYLVPVARIPLSTEPDVVHLSLYRWEDAVTAWITGIALCGRSTRQGPLADGMPVTCQRCLEAKPSYERMLAPGYHPSQDDPEQLRARLTEAHQVLEETGVYLGWMHTQAARHDVLGEDHTCAGCAIARKIRAHLEAR